MPKEYKLLREKWKPIREFEGKYEISDYGRVRNIARGGRIRKLQLNWRGYPMIHLRNGDISRSVAVHRLVAEHFLENTDILKDQVDHINNDKTNNRADNLQWCTKSFNIQKAYNDGIYKSNLPPTPRGERHPMAKLTWEEVRRMRAMHKEGIKQTVIDKKFNIPNTYVWSIVHNRNWKE